MEIGRSTSFGFWEMAYKYKWVTAMELKGAVVTENNKFGEVTKEEYKIITNVEFTE